MKNLTELKSQLDQDLPEKFKKQAEQGQNPKIAMIACPDSLVDPSKIFNANYNEIFLARDIAALVPKHNLPEAAAMNAFIQHAVQNLQVEDLVVMGHFNCGGMKAYLNQTQGQDHILNWMNKNLDNNSLIKENNNLPTNNKLLSSTQNAIKNSLSNLANYPLIETALKENNINLHGYYYDRGNLYEYNHKNNQFELFDKETIEKLTQQELNKIEDLEQINNKEIKYN